MASQSAQHPAPWYSERTARIIFLCVLCAGILLLLEVVQSTRELVQLRVFGHETRGRVIRQDVREERVTRRVQRKDVTEKVEEVTPGINERINETLDEAYSRNLSYYISQGQKEKAEDGLHVGPAPLGFKSELLKGQPEQKVPDSLIK